MSIYRVFKLESVYYGYDGNEYPAIYIAWIEVDPKTKSEINFIRTQARYFDTNKNKWLDTEEDADSVHSMMRDAITFGPAEVII